MAIVEERKPPIPTQASPKEVEDGLIVSQTSSCQPKEPSSVKPASPKDAISAVAAKIAAQTLPCSDPDVWGVLTAISTNARKRSQGINILLTADEHYIGRVVDDVRFQINSTAVSQRHCAISRKTVPKENIENPSGFCYGAFLKDTSTNGSYLNWERLKRGSSKSEAKLCHGDIISLAAPPQHEHAFAFVYREVLSSVPSSDGTSLKRKAEELSPENKRLKGIGIGAPVSLDDYRSLQHSNTELRKQLETHVLTNEALQNQSREVLERHKIEIKEMRESVSKSYEDQLNQLNESLETTRNELTAANKSFSEQKQAIEDLNEKLSSALQSYTEASEIMNSQKASIAELKMQLDEERCQRREEREKAAADLKSSVQKVQSEAEEELKQVSDAASRREREQQDHIDKLQESERQNSLLLESLRSRLEETRQKLVLSDNRVRQLEVQISDEQKSSACKNKRVEELETETRRMRGELDKEKAAREEAWAKVSLLELEISTVVRDLEKERRRLKAARERVMLRENQLRTFYSTTEEINLLFIKQQEQLKSMQRALEDEENYDDDSVDTTGENVDGNKSNAAAKAGPTTSVKRDGRGEVAETSSEEGSATEKHDCGIRTQDDEDTQEAEFPNDKGVAKDGFGSDIDGVGTAPMFEGDADGTERVIGDTMQPEDDTNVQETEQQSLRDSQLNHRDETVKTTGDAETKGITTQDLLASEVAGSWACSTAPSVYGDNDSPHNDEGENHAVTNGSNTQVAESQSSPAGALTKKLHSDHDIQALSNMIGIMAPDVKEQFKSFVEISSQEKSAKVSDSDTDSETDDECVEASKNVVDADGGSESDDATQAHDQADKNEENEDNMDVDDDTEEDSVG